VASPADDPPLVPVSPVVADTLLASLGLTSQSAETSRPRDLPSVTATIRVSGTETLTWGRNVVGVIAGSDPKLRDEAVVIGAHMDHLGRAGDRLYPGADDNASGVAALLEIARGFAASPRRPARTLVFAFWTGEEEGHLGAAHYCRHPAWPLDRTAVYLNLDMIAHPWLRAEIEKLVADTGLERGDEFLKAVDPSRFIELGLAEWAPDVGQVLLSAARGLGLALHLDRTDGRSGGSDYREFARRGVKFVRFFGNYFDGYHEPADRVEALDPEQVLRVARLALASAWLLAGGSD
jgi:Zn-dependent M28 family amino/carboxypeptidase